MKRLIFGEGLLGNVLAGDEETSLRKYREGSHDFKKGEFVKGEFMDGVVIVLQITADTEKKRIADLTNEDLRGTLFEDAEDVFNGLKHWYSELTRKDLIGIIRFEIPKIEGIPIVALLEDTE